MEQAVPLIFPLFFFGACAINILGLALWIWMLIECATKETDENNQRLIWVLIVALTSWIGALIYLIVRRPARIRELGV